jgi:hypothetical protein
METKDIMFFIAVFVGSAALIGLFYLLDRPISYKNFKPKIKDLEKDLQIFRDVYGHKKEDEKPKEEPVEKSLWDRILEAIGL